MIVIPNEKLLAVAKDAGFFESFRIADDVLRQGVQGISDIITIPGIINRDFADVKTTMAGMGHAVMGTAVRSGENRAIEAAQAAMASPLLEAGAIDGARGILINITGSSSLKLSEVNEASSLIQSAAHEDANIIFGAVLDEKMGEEVKITVIATGFRDQMPERRARMLNVEEAPVVSVPVVARTTGCVKASPSRAGGAARFHKRGRGGSGRMRRRVFFCIGGAGRGDHGDSGTRPRKRRPVLPTEFAMAMRDAARAEPRFDAMEATIAAHGHAAPRDYAGDDSRGAGAAGSSTGRSRRQNRRSVRWARPGKPNAIWMFPHF